MTVSTQISCQEFIELSFVLTWRPRTPWSMNYAGTYHYQPCTYDKYKLECDGFLVRNQQCSNKENARNLAAGKFSSKKPSGRARRLVPSAHVRSCQTLPGARGTEAAVFAERSSSATSRLIEDEHGLNPLWKIWRGADARAAETSPWSPARRSGWGGGEVGEMGWGGRGSRC